MSIITETYDETTRRLQLLGIPGEVIPPLIQYVEELNRAKMLLGQERYGHLLNDDGSLREYFDVDPGATGAGKYVQIVDMAPRHSDGEIAPSSVHSVVIKATGEVCKSAGWKGGPAKSTSKARRGQPIVVATLTDHDSFSAMLARLDVYGGYLYSR